MTSDHLNLIFAALFFLVLANSFEKLRVFAFVGFWALIGSIVTVANNLSTEAILHFGLEFMAVSILSIIPRFLKVKTLKLIYIPIALAVFYFLHPILTKKTIEIKTDPDMEILVLLNEDQDISTWIQENNPRFGIKYPLFTPLDKSTLLDEFIGINVPDNKDPKEFIKHLKNTSGVFYAELNEVLELKLPDENRKKDAFKTIQSNDPQTDKQWHADRLKMDQVHKLIQNGKSAHSNKHTMIAILDTGVDSNHEDLKDNYISINTSYDRDGRGHGTHCAGIAGAVTGNNIGIASLLPPESPVKITSIKVLSNFGIGSQAQIIAGMIEAADAGASVISMSLGGLSNPTSEKAYSEAVKYTTKANAIVVVAAGNSNRDAKDFSPANTPGVITVSAVNSDLQLASFSNHIYNLPMGIAAPGKDIYSTYRNNKYQFNSGTSMAAPFVAGLCGIIKYYNPDITTEEAYELMINTSLKAGDNEIVNPIGTLEEMFK